MEIDNAYDVFRKGIPNVDRASREAARVRKSSFPYAPSILEAPSWSFLLYALSWCYALDISWLEHLRAPYKLSYANALQDKLSYANALQDLDLRLSHLSRMANKKFNIDIFDLFDQFYSPTIVVSNAVSKLIQVGATNLWDNSKSLQRISPKLNADRFEIPTSFDDIVKNLKWPGHFGHYRTLFVSSRAQPGKDNVLALLDWRRVIAISSLLGSPLSSKITAHVQEAFALMTEGRK